jgi:thioesterase domain-containing protein
MRAEGRDTPGDVPARAEPDPGIETYLHEHIPMSAAMGVRVRVATHERVELWAPLGPNVNHQMTVFGGSAAAVATLACWTLLQLRLEQARADAQPVIQRCSMEYKQPITGDFEAVCTFEDPVAWARFEQSLARRGRARLTLTARLLLRHVEVGSFSGDFVALRD